MRFAVIWILLAGASPERATPPAAARSPVSDVSAADDAVAALFGRGFEVQRTLASVRATFTETTTSSLMVRPIVATGTMVAVKPGRIRLDYATPERKTVVIDGDRLVVVWPERGDGETLDIAKTQRNVARYFAEASLPELRRLFDIEVMDDAEMLGTHRIVMTPRKKPIQEGIIRLDLWVDRETLVIMRMTMSFPEGDEKTISLADIERDVPVDLALFDVKAPSRKRSRARR